MARLSRFLRTGAMAVAVPALMALSACSDYSGSLPKHMRPLDSATRTLVDRKGMEQRSPILLRIFKEEATLEVWKLQKSSGRYAFLKDYEICAWSGVLGPKKKEGDRQAPEGFYTIRPAQMNPDSNYYLAFNMGYPNDFDRSLGRTGSELMVHGACSSRGCYSMTDESIQEIYTLGRLAFQGGQRDFQVQAFPFRMTPQNLARHRNDPNMPFWLMLKEGYDHFETVGQPPKVDVCENRYIFNSVPGDGRSFSPSGECPPMSMPERIRTAVAEKQARDNVRMLELAERLDRRENTRGANAMSLAFAEPTSAQRAAPMSVATAALTIEPEATASVTLTSVAAAAPAERQSVVGEALAASAARAASPAPAAHVPTPRPNPRAVAAAPAPQRNLSTDPSFLPLPELRSEEVATPQPQPAPAARPLKKKLLTEEPAASLAERMLVESAPADPSVANAYAAAEEEEGGMTGFVLRLMKQEP
ncbi:MAG: L,D-transpeptidase family protein [Propylenella sp.]